MISHGDEVGRTQLATTTATARTTRSPGWAEAGQYAGHAGVHPQGDGPAAGRPVFRRRRFFDGRPSKTDNHMRDIYWITRNGGRNDLRRLAFRHQVGGGEPQRAAIAGNRTPAANGSPTTRSCSFNAHAYPVDFLPFPITPYATGWQAVIDASHPQRRHTEQQVAAGPPSPSQGPPVLVPSRRPERTGSHAFSARHPVLATYRLQMTGDAFTFADAEKIVDYLGDPRRQPPLPVAHPDRGARFGARFTTSPTHHRLGGARRS